jgi:hypothetical protein
MDTTVYVFAKIEEKDNQTELMQTELKQTELKQTELKQTELKQTELKLLCQINNVPPEARFKYDVVNNVERYYIVMQSAFDDYLDIKEFMILEEKK